MTFELVGVEEVDDAVEVLAHDLLRSAELAQCRSTQDG